MFYSTILIQGYSRYFLQRKKYTKILVANEPFYSFVSQFCITLEWFELEECKVQDSSHQSIFKYGSTDMILFICNFINYVNLY